MAMKFLTIPDIENLEECWGPTFCSILESNSCDVLSEQLESRIRNFDKDIEKICNFFYQGFIGSIRELLHVRSQIQNLNQEISSLNGALKNISSEIVTKGEKLLKGRQMEINIVLAISGLVNCLPVLESYSKLLVQIKEKNYYFALKTLEQLENDHLCKVLNYRFLIQIKAEIPKMKSLIKKSSEEDFREFLENIRKFSPKIGEIAMHHTRILRKRHLKNLINESKAEKRNELEKEEELINVHELIDFSPIYRSLHIYTVLNDREYFERDYRKQRRDQAKLVLLAPVAMHDNLESYKQYICAIVGFFVVENHIMNTTKCVVTKSYLDHLWSTSLSRAVNVISMNSSSCTDPNILLRIKNTIVLSVFTLKSYGYSTNQLTEVLVEMKDHYNEVLLQRWVYVFREILDKSEFVPLEAKTPEEYEAIIGKFPFHPESAGSQYPKIFPFSSIVPNVYHEVKEFMYACKKFSDDLSESASEVAAMVKRAANMLLTRSFSGCLSSVFQNPNLALMQVIQIIIDTQYLEKAGPFLDDFVCKLTSTEATIRQVPSMMFQIARAEAEMQVSTKLCLKLDDFFEELEGYNWLLPEPIGHASTFISDMITFLKSTFQSFSYLLPNVAQSAFRKACEHIASHIYKLLLSDEIKQISTGALQQISLDLMQCELFASSEAVPGINEADISKYFAEVRQLLDLLILEEWSTYLHDYGKSENRYYLVKPSAIIIVLEKVREADRKNMFSVLKKNERDKKKLWDTVIKQLKQLAERQT